MLIVGTRRFGKPILPCFNLLLLESKRTLTKINLRRTIRAGMSNSNQCVSHTFSFKGKKQSADRSLYLSFVQNTSSLFIRISPIKYGFSKNCDEIH